MESKVEKSGGSVTSAIMTRKLAQHYFTLKRNIVGNIVISNVMAMCRARRKIV